MLEGIQILHKTEIMEPNPILWSILPALVMAALALLLVGMFFDGNSCCLIASISCIVAALLYTLVIAIVDPQVPTDRYRYEVTIDESVPFSKLYGRYDVVEQRGEIWILEDKED